jgi:hypothetical protein
MKAKSLVDYGDFNSSTEADSDSKPDRREVLTFFTYHTDDTESIIHVDRFGGPVKSIESAKFQVPTYPHGTELRADLVTWH